MKFRFGILIGLTLLSLLIASKADSSAEIDHRGNFVKNCASFQFLNAGEARKFETFVNGFNEGSITWSDVEVTIYEDSSETVQKRSLFSEGVELISGRYVLGVDNQSTVVARSLNLRIRPPPFRQGLMGPEYHQMECISYTDDQIAKLIRSSGKDF